MADIKREYHLKGEYKTVEYCVTLKNQKAVIQSGLCDDLTFYAIMGDKEYIRYMAYELLGTVKTYGHQGLLERHNVIVL